MSGSRGAYKGGISELNEYWIWYDMKRRCLDEKRPEYYRYGGRGIDICEDWLIFEIFLHDMGFRPEGDYSLERVNNDKGYSKENCKWATRREQALNRRPYGKVKEKYINPQRNKFMVQKRIDGVLKFFGRFKKLEDAIKRRDELFGGVS